MRKALGLAILALALLLWLRPEREAGAGAALGRLMFVDVAAEAGLDLVNVSGDPRRWYIPESNGNGAAWLDFEDDGDLDLFIGNGQRLRYVDDGARLEVVTEAASRLYLNDGFLRFDAAPPEAGATREDWINACATGDVDDDGDTDLYLGCFGPDVFLRKEGTRFLDDTAASGLGNELWAASAAFGDANRDGHLDLYVANYCLFDLENPPAGGKRKVLDGVEVAWGPEGENQLGYNPGAPDVYFQNDGKGGFRESTAAAGLALEKPLCSYGCVWSDVTDDGWPDLLVANDLAPANLFVNQGDGRFRDEALERGFAFDADGKPTSAMGLLVEDVDQDGDFDVLRTNFDMEPNCLHVNDGSGRFTDKAAAYGLAQASRDVLGWEGAFFDAENDGDLDLLVANGHVYPQAADIGMRGWLQPGAEPNMDEMKSAEIGKHAWLQPTQLFEGVPHRRYGTTWQDATSAAGPGLAGLHAARGVAAADPDDDGDLDFLIVDIDAPPRLLRNDSPKLGHWLGLELAGKHENRDAIGAKVEVKAGGKTWTREVRATGGLYSGRDARVLIGLGDVARIDSVIVRWPAGNLQVVAPVPIDGYLLVRERIEETR
jgi:hypothetical protein